jgi:hypothetical protein
MSSQFVQLKRDAAFFALEQGARLEADNHPSSTDINLSGSFHK